MDYRMRNTVEWCMIIFFNENSGIEQEEELSDEIKHEQTPEILLGHQHSSFSHPAIQFDASSIHVNLLEDSIIIPRLPPIPSPLPTKEPTDMEVYLMKQLEQLKAMFDRGARCHSSTQTDIGVCVGVQTQHDNVDFGVQVCVCSNISVRSERKNRKSY
jgi:hypothetical protein